MHLSYQLTTKDYQAFFKFQNKKLRWTYGGVFLFFLLMATVPLASHDAFWLGMARGMRGPLIGYTLILCLLPLMRRWAFKKYMARPENRHAMQKCTLELTPEGIRSADAGSMSERKWGIMHRMAETPDHIFIYFLSNAAYVVPKRAFRSRKREREFRDMVQQRLKN